MKDWRTILVTAAVALGVGQGCVPPSGGGYPVSGGYPVYGSGDRYDYDNDYDDERWHRREHRKYSCHEIDDRIRHDREQLSRIDPNRKAAQWFREDLLRAQRDKDLCRAERREDRQRDEWQRDKREWKDDQQRARIEADCRRMEDRIRTDREKLSRIDDPKRKAAQWFRDDIRSTERNLADCRRRLRDTR